MSRTSGMTAQEEQDEALGRTLERLAKQTPAERAAQKKMVEDLIKLRANPSDASTPLPPKK